MAAAPSYWRFCEGLIDPVASSGVLGELHARPIFSLISDTPDSTKFVSLFSPAAVRALMKTLPLSGRARMNSSGFGANAARPFIDGRHASLIGSWEFILKRTVTACHPDRCLWSKRPLPSFALCTARCSSSPALICGLLSVGDLSSTIDQAGCADTAVNAPTHGQCGGALSEWCEKIMQSRPQARGAGSRASPR